MVIATTKSLEQRVSKKYNPGHGLAWPKYLEFHNSQDVGSTMSVTEDGAEMRKTAKCDAEAAEDFFNLASSTEARGAAEAATPHALQDVPAPAASSHSDPDIQKLIDSKKKLEWSDKIKEAVAVARKTHSEWDRKGRELKAGVAKASAHRTTSGCVVLTDLKAILEQCEVDDNVLVQYEQDYMAAKFEFEQRHLDHINSIAGSLFEASKAGTKKAQALKAIMES